MTIRLLGRAPSFVTVRDVAGVLTADSAVLSDANYPLTDSVEGFGGAPGIAVSWYTTGGTPHALDSLDLQLLFRDNRAQWIEGPTRLGVLKNTIVTFRTENCTAVYLRIVSVLSLLTASGLIVRAASAFDA